MIQNKEKRGAMFNDPNAEVVYKGHLELNGERKFVTLIRTKTQKGMPILELAMSAGVVSLKDPEQARENTPHVGGMIRIEGKKYKFGGWKNMSRNNGEYLGCQIEEQPDEEPAAF